MKRSHLLVFVLCCTLLNLCRADEMAAPAQPNGGAVNGSRYTSAFFGFSYYIPEQWMVRTVSARMPGTGADLLLSVKKKSGDALSSINVTASPLPAAYGNDLARYLNERYRPNRAESQTTINGIPTSKIKRSAGDPDAVLLNIAEHNFYRVQVDSANSVRVAVATLEKGYVVIFELITPSAGSEQTRTQFADSLLGLTFAPPTAPSNGKSLKP
jgi:hypothetical protein